MRHPVYDTSAPRRTVSLTINADLMAKAKAARINVSAVAEKAVAAALAEQEGEALKEALRRESEAYERFIAEHGSFADAVQDWLETEAPDERE